MSAYSQTRSTSVGVITSVITAMPNSERAFDSNFKPCSPIPRKPYGEVEGLKAPPRRITDRKSTRLNSSHTVISYAVFCLKKKKTHLPPAGCKSHRHGRV